MRSIKLSYLLYLYLLTYLVALVSALKMLASKTNRTQATTWTDCSSNVASITMPQCLMGAITISPVPPITTLSAIVVNATAQTKIALYCISRRYLMNTGKTKMTGKCLRLLTRSSNGVGLLHSSYCTEHKTHKSRELYHLVAIVVINSQHRLKNLNSLRYCVSTVLTARHIVYIQRDILCYSILSLCLSVRCTMYQNLVFQ